MPVAMNPEIFREYDIRGVADRDLTPEVVKAIGSALGTYIQGRGERRILVGMDNRASSPAIRDSLTEGILGTGCDVLDIGIVVTPAFYYSRILYGIDGGAMITASHNPPEFNGLKVAAGPATIYGEEIQRLRQMAELGSFRSGRGNLSSADPSEQYINMILDKVRLGQRKLRVVVDCGNGTASFFAPKIIEGLGCDVIPLYCESDPSFPNHFPDPVRPENLRDL
ncbi:MAG TPA: phosphomannomutase, partial [Firmicutes bacterium]|nr:phosphomannomutase [Bacillota bacterium]